MALTIAGLIWGHGFLSLAAQTNVACFASPNRIAIPDIGPGVPYPSTVLVSGVTGTITKVTVTLSNLSHSFGPDLSILLAGPGGQTVLLMSDAGPALEILNATLTFADDAGTSLPAQSRIVTGTFKPTSSGNPAPFPSPAPAGPFGESLAIFNGTNPNGPWRLFVMDDAPEDAGSIEGGWSLRISLVPDDIAVSVSTAPNPVAVGENLTLTLTLTNLGPSPATGVRLTNSLPMGVALVSAVASQGNCAGVAGQVICDVPTVPPGVGAVITVVATANSAGTLTNVTSISRAEPDGYEANNCATTVLTVLSPALSINHASVREGNAGTTNAVFTVTLWPPLSRTVSVRFATSNDTAVAGRDYLPGSGTIFFPPGATNQALNVQVLGDVIHEVDETFSITLFEAANAIIAQPQGRGLVIDDDPPPSLSIDDVAVVEGDSGTTDAVFTVTLSGATEELVTVHFGTLDGTATAPGDYRATNGTLIFPPGLAGQTITVAIQGDGAAEPNEDFFVNLSNPVNGTLARSQGRATIVNDDKLPGQLDHFVWNVITSPQWVNSPFPATLAAQDGFNAIVTNFNGNATVSAWTSSTLLITELDTAGGARIEFANVSPAAVDLSGWQLTLYDADSWPAPKLGFAIPPATICPPGGVFMLSDAAPFPGAYPSFNTGTNLAWSEAEGPMAVLLRDQTGRVVDFVCAGVLDPAVSADPLAIPAGEWMGSALAVNRDSTKTFQRIGSADHNDRTDWVLATPSMAGMNSDLAHPFAGRPVAIAPTNTVTFTNGIWTGNITVLDPRASIFLAANDGSDHSGVSRPFAAFLQNDLSVEVLPPPQPPVMDNDFAWTLVVSNSGPLAAAGVALVDAVPASITLVSVNASQGSCTQASGLVDCQLGALDAGGTTVVTLIVRSAVDGPITNVAQATRTGTDPYLPNNAATNVVSVVPPRVSIGDARVTEGADGLSYATFTVWLSAPIAKAATVDYVTADGTATAGVDYLPGGGTVIFSPGVTTQTVSVAVRGDGVGEPDENFFVILSNPRNAAIARNPALGVIVDDDPPGNDQFDNRTLISGSSATLTGFNANAGREPGEPSHAGNSSGKSVWWTWTAPMAGSITIDTLGSDFDTVLGVYTGASVSALTLVASDHGSGGWHNSQVTFEAAAGATYQIAVDGWNGSAGNIVLNLRLANGNPLPPAARLRPDFWDVNGTVYSLLATNGVVYVGGSFTYAAPSGRKVTALDAYTSEADAEFPAIFGSSINVILEDGKGGWYIGGNFSSVGGLALTNLAHILSDNTVDPAFHPHPDNTVRALVLAGDILYVAGDFLGISGERRRRIAALDLPAGTVSPWSPEADNRVSALAVSGNAVFAGGSFAQIGRQARNHLAALDMATGFALPWDPDADGAVLALALDNGRVLAGGTFNRIGGQLRNHLAAIDLTTATATDWDPAPDGGQISALLAVCNTVYAAGDFTAIGGQARSRVAALDINTGQATAWNPNLDLFQTGQVPSRVHCLAMSGDTIYLGGEFVGLNGQSRRDLVSVDARTGSVLPWDPRFAGGVSALAVSGRKVLAGSITAPGGLERRNLAAFDELTGRVTDWNPGADGPVYALAFASNTVYAGGSFTNVGGQPRNRIAGIAEGTGQPTPWAPNASDTVYALAISGEAIYAGGSFTSIDGLPRQRVAALRLTGEVAPWSPQADNTVYALSLSGDTLYAGGDFTYIGGQTRNFLAALDLQLLQVLPWNPNANGSVHALAVSGSVVYAGGSFTILGGLPHRRLAALDAISGQPVEWNADADAEVRALVRRGDSLFAGGDFLTIGGVNRQGLAALHAVTGGVLDWAPGNSDQNRIFALAASERMLYAGGADLLEVSGSPADHSLLAFPRLGAPALEHRMQDQQLFPGETAVFSAAPTGQSPLAFQWQFNGADLPGATNSTLVLSNLQLHDSGAYRVIVTNSLGAITAEATLTVLEPVTITVQPVSQTLAPGNTLALTVSATGNPSPIYQWRLNGVNIPGAVFPALTITNAQPADGGSYSVVVANSLGAWNSAIAEVVVASPALPLADNLSDRVIVSDFAGVGSGNNLAATFEAGEPRHAGKSGGKSVWLGWRAPASGIATFSTRGSGLDTLLAVYTGTAITNLAPVASDEDRGGFLTSQVIFNAVEGVEYLVAIDGFAGAAGNLVLSWNLEVTADEFPRIATQPLSQSVAEAQSVVFAVAATSPTPLAYQWFFGCREIPGATNATLAIAAARRTDVGPYTVFVMNHSSRVAVSLPAYLEIGQPGVLSQDKVEDILNSASGITNSLKRPESIADNSVGAGFISVALGVTVSQTFVNTNATTGLTESNHCGVLGGASKWLSFQAQDNGVIMLDTIGSSIDTLLAVYTTNSIFSFNLIACDDNSAPDHVRSLLRFNAVRAKPYLAVVDGVHGAEGLINLNWQLGRAPVIVSSSASLSVFAGTNLVLRSGIDGAIPAPAYQWRLNGKNLAGATNELLILNNLQAAQAGTYSVVASNFAGRLTNVCAILSVTTPLRLEHSSRVSEGQFRLRVTGNPGQTFILQASTNLTAWDAVLTNQVSGVPAEFTDTNVHRFNSRFYRALAWP